MLFSQQPQNSNYSALERILLQGMNDFHGRIDNPYVPAEYKHKGSKYQNVHEIKLEADVDKWNNAVWFLLKPRFLNDMKSSGFRCVQELIQNILELQELPSYEMTQSILDKTLIHDTQNNRVFESFIMLKRLDERLFQASPYETEITTTEQYQAKRFHSDASTYEKELIGSLWPAVKDPSQWERWSRESHAPDYDNISLVLQTMQGIIAQIAIQSSIEASLFEFGRQQQREFRFASYSPDLLGLCDLKQDELISMIDGLLSLPATRKVADWLARNEASHSTPLTKTLSQLFGAILKTPANVDDFLAALNLKNSSAKTELEKIAKIEADGIAAEKASADAARVGFFEMGQRHQRFDAQKMELEAKIESAFTKLEEVTNESADAKALFLALDEERINFISNLSFYLQPRELDAAIKDFRKKCAKYFERADKIAIDINARRTIEEIIPTETEAAVPISNTPKHIEIIKPGWLARLVEAIIKAVTNLFKRIFSLNNSSPSSREAQEDTNRPIEITHRPIQEPSAAQKVFTRRLLDIKQILLGDDLEDKGLVDGTDIKPNLS